MPDGIALDAQGAVWIANPIAPECARYTEGGDDGRTLFMLTARSSDAHQAATEPTGKLLIATVEHPRAGRP